SILDLWLMVALCAWVFAIALSTLVNAGRFDIGFYAGRLSDLAAVSVVAVVFLIEGTRPWGRLYESPAPAGGAQARRATSREEAIGQLTGGVAHDFNNLLTVVIGNLELISMARGEIEKIERMAQNAMKAARQGEHLVRQLLTYARRQISYPQIVNLNQLIAN